ncbi:hypothetical protein COT97_00880 [Candidatus Falkowbacteria bacterium CG10_big_fil_rev_8_21_14_0_10_39_11]|uniref:Uncharacterized protein n=1 Tax=Candidatus Falkowbacteria bacterium CG10_big_fil_rev_8_21_14_0_10_39_11 TaxID=1974565 RepID=A0A2H0V5Y8_9BACT|nr:MAG: hypothetical protein COT97_00880 [Candidatus Falkowbacteria bacterium CG10_big_fil_rev_8_21_14_0_10_39_11]
MPEVAFNIEKTIKEISDFKFDEQADQKKLSRMIIKLEAMMAGRLFDDLNDDINFLTALLELICFVNEVQEISPEKVKQDILAWNEKHFPWQTDEEREDFIDKYLVFDEDQIIFKKEIILPKRDLYDGDFIPHVTLIRGQVNLVQNNFTTLPSGLIVANDLDITGNRFHQLQALTVVGKVSAKDNPITTLGKELTVDGELLVDGEKLSLIYDDVMIRTLKAGHKLSRRVANRIKKLKVAGKIG